MTDFAGFPAETVRFLGDLAANNDKQWFDAHREDYEAYWLAPARAFVVAAGEALREVVPDIRSKPRVNGSIFRVNRDIRFSKDKSPYKDHLDFWFWEGERKRAVSGFYMRITPTELGIGVGAHDFDKDRLDAFRRAVVDPDQGRALSEIATRRSSGPDGRWTARSTDACPAASRLRPKPRSAFSNTARSGAGRTSRSPPRSTTAGWSATP